MSVAPPRPRATPFHLRAAEANARNDWTERNGVMLARIYTSARDEALAARLRVGLIDISWRWRVLLEGARVGDFLGRLVTREAAPLAPGEALKALWLGDDGTVRGAGAIARFGRARFYLVAAAPDAAWVAAAAARFGVSVRDMADRYGGLAIAGPYAARTLARAGIDPRLALLSFRRQSWGALDVTLSRWGELNGYEIWCRAEDGALVWERLMRAGAAFGIAPVGTVAAELLDLEIGIARPGRDYVRPMSPRALGLESLIDETNTRFNGRAAWRAGRESERLRLVGVAFDGGTPASHTPLLRNGVVIGHTLASAWSPALARAVALASVDSGAAAPGTVLSLALPPSAKQPELRTARATVCELPFLPPP